MIESAYYFVSREIALRSGLLKDRYRVRGGRFVLDNKDLSRIRFSPDEYINGLAGIEKTDKATAMALIEANGYVMGDNGEDIDIEETQEETNETEE